MSCFSLQNAFRKGVDMTNKMKVKTLIYSVSLVIFCISWVILYFTFESLSAGYKGMISVGLSVILVPRIKEYESQSGKQIQLKWIFLKKLISI